MSNRKGRLPGPGGGVRPPRKPPTVPGSSTGAVASTAGKRKTQNPNGPRPPANVILLRNTFAMILQAVVQMLEACVGGLRSLTMVIRQGGPQMKANKILKGLQRKMRISGSQRGGTQAWWTALLVVAALSVTCAGLSIMCVDGKPDVGKMTFEEPNVLHVNDTASYVLQCHLSCGKGSYKWETTCFRDVGDAPCRKVGLGPDPEVVRIPCSQPHGRASRSAPEDKFASFHTDYKQAEAVVIGFIRGHTAFVLIGIFCLAWMLNWNRLIVVIILLLAYSTGAFGYQRGVTLHSAGESISYLPLSVQMATGVVINSTTHLEVICSDVDLGKGDKIGAVCVKASFGERKDSDTCAGGKDLPQAAEGQVCKQAQVFHSIVQGCFWEATGGVQTCVKVNCTSSTDVFRLRSANSRLVCHLLGNGEMKSVKLGVEPTTTTLGTKTVRVSCRSDNDLSANYYSVGGVLAPKEMVSLWHTDMLTSEGELVDPRAMVEFGTVHVSSIDVRIRQSAFSESKLHSQAEEFKKTLRFSCTLAISLRDDVDVCNGTYTGLQVTNGMGVVTYAVENAPCHVRVRCDDELVAGSDQVVAAKSGTLRFKVLNTQVCAVVMGTSSIVVNPNVSVMGKFIDTIRGHWQVAAQTGGFWSHGSGLLTNWMSKLASWRMMAIAGTVGLVLVVTWNPTLAVVVGVLLMAMSVHTVGVGCDVNFERKQVECGRGITVWDESGSRQWGALLNSTEPMEFLANLHPEVCLFCSRLVECEAIDAALQSHYYIHTFTSLDKKVEYNVKNSFFQLAHERVALDIGGSVVWIGNVTSGKVNRTSRGFPHVSIVSAGNVDVGCPIGYIVFMRHVGWQRDIFGSRSVMQLESRDQKECPTEFMGAAVKDGMSMHGDETMMLEGVVVGEHGRFLRSRTKQMRQCRWPASHTVDLVADSAKIDYVVPLQIGGPKTWANHLPGWSTEWRWNWTQPPYSISVVTIGTLLIDKHCGVGGPIRYSPGTAYCCRKCANPIPVFEREGVMWLPGRIQKTESHAETVKIINVDGAVQMDEENIDHFLYGNDQEDCDIQEAVIESKHQDFSPGRGTSTTVAPQCQSEFGQLVSCSHPNSQEKEKPQKFRLEVVSLMVLLLLVTRQMTSVHSILFLFGAIVLICPNSCGPLEILSSIIGALVCSTPFLSWEDYLAFLWLVHSQVGAVGWVFLATGCKFQTTLQRIAGFTTLLGAIWLANAQGYDFSVISAFGVMLWMSTTPLPASFVTPMLVLLGLSSPGTMGITFLVSWFGVVGLELLSLLWQRRWCTPDQRSGFVRLAKGFRHVEDVHGNVSVEDERENFLVCHSHPESVVEEKRRTMHHGLGFLSKSDLAPITPTVRVGSRSGPREMVEGGGVSGSQTGHGTFMVQKGLPMFWSKRVYASGTPVFNSNGSICSVITKARREDDLHGYVLSGVRGNVRLQSERGVHYHTKNKPMVCGSREFETKEELVEALAGSRDPTDGIHVWTKPDGLQVSVVADGHEIFNQHFDGDVANEDRSTPLEAFLVADGLWTGLVGTIGPLLSASSLGFVAYALYCYTNPLLEAVHVGGFPPLPTKQPAQGSPEVPFTADIQAGKVVFPSGTFSSLFVGAIPVLIAAFLYDLRLFLFVGVCIFFHDRMQPAGKRSFTRFSVLPTAVERVEDKLPRGMRSGLYRIYNSQLWWKHQVGAGCVIQDVFYTSYHVTKGGPVLFGSTWVCSSGFDMYRDYAMYGAYMPITEAIPDTCFTTAIINGGGIFTSHHRLETLKMKNGDDAYHFQLDYPYGTSGSPIFSAEGKLIGIYGNGFIDASNVFHSILIAPNEIGPHGGSVGHMTSQPSIIGEKVWNTTRPGGGKTRRDLLEYARDARAMNHRMVVLTPTRVVKAEAASALKEAGIPYFGSSSNIGKVMLTLICHATFVCRFVRDPQCLRNVQVVVMDEAHFLDPLSITARGILEDWHRTSGKLVLMTATPPGFNSVCESNFPIEDIHEIAATDSQIVSLVGRHPTQRIVVFVGSASQAETISRMVGTDAICLHRGVYVKNSPLVKDKRVIVTTDISEMGANYDVDMCIDTRKTIKPMVQNEETVVLRERCIGHAAINQRRGRVGRRRAGVYVFTHKEIGSDIHDVCWVEAQMILDQFRMPFLSEEGGKAPQALGHYTLSTGGRELFLDSISSKINHLPVWMNYKIASLGMEANKVDWFSYAQEEKLFEIPRGQYEGVEFRPLFRDERLERNGMEFVVRTLEGEFMEHATRGLTFWRFVASQLSFRTRAYISWLTVPLFTNFDSSFMGSEYWTAVMTLAGIGSVFLLGGLWLVKRVCCGNGGKGTGDMKDQHQQPYYTGYSLPGGGCSVIPDGMFSMHFADLCIGLLYLFGHPQFAVMYMLCRVMSTLLMTVIYRQSGTRGTGDVVVVVLLMLGMFVPVGVYAINQGWLIKAIGVVAAAQAHQFPAASALPPPAPAVTSGAGGVPLAGEVLYSLLGFLSWIQEFVPFRPLVNQQGFQMSVVFSCVTVAFDMARTMSINWRLQSGEKYYRGEPGSKDRVCVDSPGFIFDFMSVSTICCLFMSFYGTMLDYIVGISGGMLLYKLCKGGEDARFMKDAADTKNGERTSGNNQTVVPEVIHNAEGNYTWVCAVGGLLLLMAVEVNQLNSLQWMAFVGMSAMRGRPGFMGSNATPGKRVLWTMVLSPRFPLALGFLGLCNLGESAGYRAAWTGVLGVAGQWKAALNRMPVEMWRHYRFRAVNETQKGELVSRGGLKLFDLMRRSSFEPRGSVIDLGCGSGGWSQVAASRSQVVRVNGYTAGNLLAKGARTHNIPMDFATPGYQKVSLTSDVDVFHQDVQQCDTVLCDIGEANANMEVEAGLTLKVIELMTRWMESNPGARFCFKVHCPGHADVIKRLEEFQRRFGGCVWRSEYSRNSTAEMYMISGDPKPLIPRIMSTYGLLLRRIILVEPPFVGEEFKFRELAETVEPEENRSMFQFIKERVGFFQYEFRHTLFKEIRNPYTAFKYYGSYVISKVGQGGLALNPIVRNVMWLWETNSEVTRISMTDVSAESQQEVFSQKVDTHLSVVPAWCVAVNRTISTWIWTMLSSQGKPRLLGRKEFEENLRNNAAVGGWCHDINWGSVTEAMDDPVFWQLVDEERARHLAGTCKFCIYNVMGKKEKKPKCDGLPRGSRAIWYYWLGGRFLEFEAFGFLNVDHWVERKRLPAGVGGQSVHHFGYLLRELGERCSFLIADDVAGWDTKVTREDLMDECGVTDFMEPEHRLIARSLHEVCYQQIVAMVPRPTKESPTGYACDLVSRGDQRASGQVVTYAMNTITNTKVLLGRAMEAQGFFQGIETMSEEEIKRMTWNWMDNNAHERMSNMLVAGDDAVVGWENERYGTALRYINATNKIRKDIGLWTPSKHYKHWEEVEFCSHHFHVVTLGDGRAIVAPDRDQNELIGRARVQKGGSVDYKEAAMMAKAYANYWLIYFFAKRDLRLGAFGILSSVPTHWVPTGMTTWSCHVSHEWMTGEDMLRVWNKVWILDNPYMHDKTIVLSWSAVPYFHRTLDKKCGGQIAHEKRPRWASEMDSTVLRVRKMVDAHECYRNELSNMGRYSGFSVL